MERQWTAAVAVVASKCATKAGHFELEFLREKENSFPLEFREQSPGWSHCRMGGARPLVAGRWSGIGKN
jgi:hypothetical protein